MYEEKSTENSSDKVCKDCEIKNANDSDSMSLENMEPVKKKMKGSPPYDDDSNYYTYLHDREEEDNEEEEEDFDMKMKNIDNFMDSKATASRPLKKRKTNKNEEKDEEDFDAICEEMASLPVVEYAYSCDDKRVLFNYKIKDGKIECKQKEPKVIESPPGRIKLSKNARAEIEATDGILKLEIDEDNSAEDINTNINYNVNRRVLLNNFHIIKNDPSFNQYTDEVRRLPKVYDAVYPIMLNELIKNNYYKYHFGMMDDEN